MMGIHDMVNRCTDSGVPFGPGEAVTPQQALRSYAHGSAFAAHMDEWLGTLEVGKAADIAILSDDPTRIDPSGIRTIGVTNTIVDGHAAYDPAGEFD